MNTTKPRFRFVHARKSRIGPDAPSAKAFRWIMTKLTLGLPLKGPSGHVELRHEGSCGRCGRTLTVDASIDSGLGPVCAAKLGAEWSRRVDATQFVPLDFILAGNATVTATSSASGTHFTYNVRRARSRSREDDNSRRPWLVSVLTGPENETDYTYLGVIWDEEED